MILAVGLSPAWQHILCFDSFRPGEVNRATASHWCASGKVLNVGLAVRSLGREGATLAPLGGQPFDSIDAEFQEAGALRHWVRTRSPTRTCTTILDSGSGTTTELVEEAAPFQERELDEFTAEYARLARRADVVVMTGSLPSGTPPSFYRRLLMATPVRAVLDVRGPELLAALPSKPFVVKPNREELARTLGRPIDDADLAPAMRELNRLGAQWVIVTQGKDAVLVSSLDEAFRLSPPSVEVVNPIGCGDCLAAGLACGLCDDLGFPDAVRFGVAAAVDNARRLLPSRLDPAGIAAMAQKVEIQAI